jgi:hypothetical protein
MQKTMIPEYLQEMLPESVVKQHSRGIRRYFPIQSKTKRGWKYLHETFYIIYGRQPLDNSEVGFAILSQGLDTYVERFDGKLWVRTICVD